MDNNQLRLKFEALTGKNYEIWIDHIKDMLITENLEDVFEASEIEAGQPNDDVNIPNGAPGVRKTKQLKAVWSFIRNALDEEIYAKTVNNDEIVFADPVSLLRYLRKNWHNNSIYDREHIRNTFESLSLESCKDMEDFINEF